MEREGALCNVLAAAQIPAPLLISTAKSHDRREKEGDREKKHGGRDKPKVIQVETDGHTQPINVTGFGGFFCLDFLQYHQVCRACAVVKRSSRKCNFPNFPLAEI